MVGGIEAIATLGGNTMHNRKNQVFEVEGSLR